MKRVLLALALALSAFAGNLSLSAPAHASGILVAECVLDDACWNGPFVPWSDNLDLADLTGLGLGTSQDLTAIQTDCCYIRLSNLQIVFQTGGGPVNQTLPDFDGGGVTGEVDLLGSYFIPLDATSAVISGTFGNSNSDSTAAQRIYFGQVPAGAPEAATWAMMLIGFGGIGAALRSRRRIAVAA
jgi:hypothetical protein